MGGSWERQPEDGGIDTWSRCVDGLRQPGYETKAAVDKVKSWRSLVQVPPENAGTKFRVHHALESSENRRMLSQDDPK